MGAPGYLHIDRVGSRPAQGDWFSVSAAEFFVTVAVATAFFIELGTAHIEHIAALIIGGVLAAPFGAYVVRHVPPHALMAVVGFLVSALALFQLVKSMG